ncbi:MAG: hypothetical protein DHS20C14_02530 [Phycisphaeraceae bacterium]|nr:MAG: hypothetical protein DHS20C14_02530 [Phycisphaeraceae bacterium]
MKRTWIIAIMALTAGWWWGVPGAHAQPTDTPEIGVSAEIERRRVYVGDRVRFQITVSGSNTPEVPDLTLPPGVAGEYRGGRERSSSFTTIVNGRRTVRSTLAYVFEYHVSPQEAGEFTIGPVEVVVDGQTYTTNRVTLGAVQPQDASAEYPITAELARTDLWAGEAVPIRVTWYIGGDVESPSFDVTTLPDSVQVLPNRTPPDWTGARERRMGAVLGQELVMDFGREQRDGREVRTLSFDLLVSPSEPGTYELGPVGVVFDRVVRGRGRVRVISVSDPITVTVRPPPIEGRPAGYAGLIGRYGVTTQASATAANVGDPITLTLRLEGDEPMVGVGSGPDLGAIEAFTDGFQLAADGWDPVTTQIPGRRIFQTTIRPLSADVTEIPAIPVAYFDVGEGVYRVAESEPIPLFVRAVREITAADALMGSAPASIARSGLDSVDDTFWAHERGPGVLTPDGFDPIERVTSPVWIVVLVAPPAAYALAFVGLAATRARDPEAARRRGALAHARRELKRSGAGSAARRLVADLVGRSPESVTADDCGSLALDAPTRADLVGLIETEEATRFGAHIPSAQDSARTLRVLRSAYRQTKGGA